MPPLWKNSLATSLNPSNQSNPTRLTRTALVGVGNDLRGDDSAGLAVIRRILALGAASESLLPIEGGPAPENITGALRKFQPEQVIFVDAAHLEEPPGSIRWIEPDEIDGMSASSHSLPLSMLAKFIQMDIGCQVRILGIQPAQNEIGETLSKPVAAAIAEIASQFLAWGETTVPHLQKKSRPGVDTALSA